MLRKHFDVVRTKRAIERRASSGGGGANGGLAGGLGAASHAVINGGGDLRRKLASFRKQQQNGGCSIKQGRRIEANGTRIPNGLTVAEESNGKMNSGEGSKRSSTTLLTI